MSKKQDFFGLNQELEKTHILPRIFFSKISFKQAFLSHFDSQCQLLQWRFGRGIIAVFKVKNP